MRFQVDPGQVQAMSARTQASAATLSQEVTAMMANLTALQEAWVGPASAAFSACAQQWRQAQIQVETALANISQQLQLASRSYSDTESAATALFAGQ